MSADQAVATKILSMIDLTSLTGSEREQDLLTLCQRAVNPLGNTAAVCVYPEFVEFCARTLSAPRRNPVGIATVVNFPSGEQSVDDIVKDTEWAIAQGATEVDMVLPYRALLRGDVAFAGQAVRACKNACKADVLLKVIIESGELKSESAIRSACEVALSGGADFIKTSTGKVPVNATLAAAKVILNCIKESAKTHVGFKASGGIRTLAQASEYLALAEQVMGADWATPTHLRFGASALLDDVLGSMQPLAAAHEK